MTRCSPSFLLPVALAAGILSACSDKKPAEPTLTDLGALEACAAAPADAFERDCAGQIARVELIVTGSDAQDGAAAQPPATSPSAPRRLEGRVRHGVLGIVATGPDIAALPGRSAATVIGKLVRRDASGGDDSGAAGPRLVLDGARIADAIRFLGPRSSEEVKAAALLDDGAAERLQADAAELGRHAGRAVACGWLQWSSDLRDVRDLLADYPTERRTAALSQAQAERVRVAFETAESVEYNRVKARTALCTGEYDMAGELAALEVERDRRLLFKARIESDVAAADEAAVALDAAEKHLAELTAKHSAAPGMPQKG